VNEFLGRHRGLERFDNVCRPIDLLSRVANEEHILRAVPKVHNLLGKAILHLVDQYVFEVPL
jgi:hypothetical protein